MVRWMAMLLGVLGTTPSARADAGGVEEKLLPKDSWTFSVYVENDLFANTDRDYTNGTKITMISPDVSKYTDSGAVPDLFAPLLRLYTRTEREGAIRNVAISLGQNMYTPEDITTTEFQPDDRPYAGWSYLGLGLHAKTTRRLDTLELSLGMVGPASLAEDTQKLVHRIIDAQRPNGWKHQLANEPAINLVYERKYRVFYWGDEGGLGMDFVAHGGGSLGNVFTYLNAGGSLRAGLRVPRDFGTTTIRLAGGASAPTSPEDPRFGSWLGLGFHLFASVDGRVVARDIFLDGNTFADSHSVDKNPFVADLAIGAAITVSRVKASYATVVRTNQWEGQEEPQVFGSITLSASF